MHIIGLLYMSQRELCGSLNVTKQNWPYVTSWGMQKGGGVTGFT